MKILKISLHGRVILLDKPQSFKCGDGVYRTIDGFCTNLLHKRSVEIILLRGNFRIATLTKRLKLVGEDIAKNGIITVSLNRKAYTVGNWEKCEEV